MLNAYRTSPRKSAIALEASAQILCDRPGSLFQMRVPRATAGAIVTRMGRDPLCRGSVARLYLPRGRARPERGPVGPREGPATVIFSLMEMASWTNSRRQFWRAANVSSLSCSR